MPFISTNELFRETFIGQALNHASHNHWLAYTSDEPSTRSIESPALPRDLESARPDCDAVTGSIAQQGDATPSIDGSISGAKGLKEWSGSTHDNGPKDSIVVSWDGSDDPANPQNWSLPKKVFVTALICLLTFSIYIGSAIYTVSYQSIEEEFNVSGVVTTLGLSLYVLGYATGPMLFAPIAETPLFGRTMVYLPTHLVFILLNFGVIYASNISMVLVFRFLTGFFGSPVLATGGASLADLWSPSKRAYAIGIWGLFAVLGPTMGPLCGGYAVEAEEWTWSIRELVWLNAVCLFVLMFCLPETGPQNILFRKAHRLRKSSGNEAYRSQGELELVSMDLKSIALESLSRPFLLCFTEPILLCTNMYLGLIYAILYTWFEAFPFVFNDLYHFDLGSSGLTFLGLLVGAVVIMGPYLWWLRVFQEPQFDANGDITPEQRLPPAIIGSVFIPVCLFWFGWSSKENVHWIVPIIASALFPMGAVLLFNALLLYQGDTYPKYVGSVLAGNDLVRGVFGASFPLFATAMFRRLHIDWGCSLLGFLSLLFVPIPILFWRYGKTLRLASKNARHDI